MHTIYGLDRVSLAEGVRPFRCVAGHSREGHDADEGSDGDRGVYIRCIVDWAERDPRVSIHQNLSDGWLVSAVAVQREDGYRTSRSGGG